MYWMTPLTYGYACLQKESMTKRKILKHLYYFGFQNGGALILEL